MTQKTKTWPKCHGNQIKLSKEIVVLVTKTIVMIV